jgi:KaiC/GvpD/RAD55 family RecA-like ATPase
MARAIRVLKTRASVHDPVRHEFELTSDGIVLADTSDRTIS